MRLPVVPMTMVTVTEALRIHHNNKIHFFTALLLLCASGSLHFSWTIQALILYVYKYQDVQRDVLLAWFFGAAFGVIFGAWINKKFSKLTTYVSDWEKVSGSCAEFLTVFYHFSSTPQYFVAVNIACVSVLFICSPQSEYDFLFFGRAFSGILYGITLLTLVLHTADNASQFFRRYLLWTIALINILPSILMAGAISYRSGISGNLNVSLGLVMLSFGILALILMPCTHESVMYLLYIGKDLKALEILLNLRNESRHFIRTDFNNMKIMVAEDKNVGGNILRHGNWRPLLLILLIRMLSPLVANNILASVSIMNIWLDHQRVAVQQTHEAVSLMAAINVATTNYSLPYKLDAFAQIANDTRESIDNNATKTGNDSTTFTTSKYQSDDIRTKNEWKTAPNTAYDIATASVLTVDEANQLYFIHTAYEYKPCILDAQYILLFIFVVKVIVGVPLMCWAEKLYIFRNRFVFKATLAVAVLNLTFCTFSWCAFRFENHVLYFTFYMFKLQNIINESFVVIAFAIDVIGLNELAEAFPLSKRSGSIAFVLMIEYLVHILYLLPIVIFHHLPFYLNFIHWTFIIGISYFLIRHMPNESLDKTLRHACDKFFI